MKYNIKKSFFLAALASLTLSGCGDFLEIEPRTFVSEDNFWNEKADIEQMVIGTYAKMQDDAYIRRCIVWGETRSDNIIEGLNTSSYTNLYRTLRNDLMSTNEFTNWQTFYSVINQCNVIIARAPEVSAKDPVYTESDVKATQAEMAFLRDLSYFYLVRAFKDVPYYTYPIQADEDARPIAVTDGDSIVKALIVDLESVVSNALKAYPKDNSTRFNSNRNRATQTAIYSLLADLCLWDGQYQKCVDYSQKVIDAKMDEYREDYASRLSSSQNVIPTVYKWSDDKTEGYPLYPCYTDNTTFGGSYNAIFGSGNSFESIFELSFNHQFDGDGYINNSACAALYGNHYDIGNSGQGFLAAGEEFTLDPNTNKKLFDHRRDCRQYASVTNNGDGNAVKTYSSKMVNSIAEIKTSSDDNKRYLLYTGAPYTAVVSHHIGNYHDLNWIFYRLTDVMLMQAEALIMTSPYGVYQPTDENNKPLSDENGERIYDENLRRAFGLIYAVNRRSIMVFDATSKTTDDLAIANYSDRDAMLDLCMQERRRELMFEGKRWFDMLRICHREKSVEYIKNHVSAKSGGSKPVNYENLFWPYYKYEIQNNPLLTQKAYYGEDDQDGNFTSTK